MFCFGAFYGLMLLESSQSLFNRFLHNEVRITHTAVLKPINKVIVGYNKVSTIFL